MSRDQKPAKSHRQTRARGKVLTSGSRPPKAEIPAPITPAPIEKPVLSRGLIATYWVACAIGGAGAAYTIFTVQGQL